MKAKLYSIYDKLADQLSPVFQQPTDLSALRMFEKSMNQAQLDPADYSLVCVGLFWQDEDHPTRYGVDSIETYVVTPDTVADTL